MARSCTDFEVLYLISKYSATLKSVSGVIEGHETVTI